MRRSGYQWCTTSTTRTQRKDSVVSGDENGLARVYQASIAASTVVPNIPVEVQDTVTPDSLRPPRHVRCTIDGLDLAVDGWRISSAVGHASLSGENRSGRPRSLGFSFYVIIYT
ncbi:unnamed protein product [Macrosiphum euphorbiae]|uniref:Uncharacterized protein n=1 Tax=Macrosiphum euphorbiae TaxID=13131 RepID=A0AAV0XCG2_9HEMI|nr:unnamed protein product [Macrosiphum euphorbiae]